MVKSASAKPVSNYQSFYYLGWISGIKIIIVVMNENFFYYSCLLYDDELLYV